MEVTLDIEPRTFSLINKAKELGISVDDVIQKALVDTTSRGSDQPQLTSQAWIESFRNWTKQSKLETSISDESLRRENIYDDRN